ncbi:hypothetical protein VE03_10606 [Pseudogymnoascus sp. 23342-1-I1]|nr:hypothetical protein VE03_10606 [Pseudogymnoascus sp. 23342-1-I1]
MPLLIGKAKQCNINSPELDEKERGTLIALMEVFNCSTFRAARNMIGVRQTHLKDEKLQEFLDKKANFEEGDEAEQKLIKLLRFTRQQMQKYCHAGVPEATNTAFERLQTKRKGGDSYELTCTFLLATKLTPAEVGDIQKYQNAGVKLIQADKNARAKGTKRIPTFIKKGAEPRAESLSVCDKLRAATPRAPPPATEDGDDGDIHHVKRILAEGGSDDNRVFLIEWEGYPLEESTWEPKDNIFSEELLEAWEEEKIRQREGLSQPLDMDEFDRNREEHDKRKLRLEKPLGFENEGCSAKEGYVEDEGISQPRKLRRHASRDDDIVMNDASNSSGAPPTDRRRAPTNRAPNLHSTIAPRGKSLRGKARTTKPRAPTIQCRILNDPHSKEAKAPHTAEVGKDPTGQKKVSFSVEETATFHVPIAPMGWDYKSQQSLP